MRRAMIITWTAGLALWVHAGPGLAQPPANPLLQIFDTDHDGTLSAVEIDAAATKLKERDTNKDGQLSADEIRPAFRGGQGRGRGGPGSMDGGGLQKPPLAKDEGEKRILAALNAARRGERYANVSESDGRLLRQLTESIGAKRVVELGTSTGESGLWFSLALRKTGGKLYTHDIDPGRIAVARENFKRAGVDDIVIITEGDAHETARRNPEPIDVLFIDAEKQGYARYLEELLPQVRPGGLVIAHNMHMPPPDPGYIEAITSSPDLDTSFVLMDGAGVGITLKKR